MSMKNWTDEELFSTRDKLDEWNSRYQKSSNKMWHFTAFLGAFAVSTGIAFIFLDGLDVLNVLLIAMGSLTCFAWYKSEKRRKDNQTFLTEINRELKQRKKKSSKSKTKYDGSEKGKTRNNAQQDNTAELNSTSQKDAVNNTEQETRN